MWSLTSVQDKLASWSAPFSSAFASSPGARWLELSLVESVVPHRFPLQRYAHVYPCVLLLLPSRWARAFDRPLACAAFLLHVLCDALFVLLECHVQTSWMFRNSKITIQNSKITLPYGDAFVVATRLHR